MLDRRRFDMPEKPHCLLNDSDCSRRAIYDDRPDVPGGNREVVRRIGELVPSPLIPDLVKISLAALSGRAIAHDDRERERGLILREDGRASYRLGRRLEVSARRDEAHVDRDGQVGLGSPRRFDGDFGRFAVGCDADPFRIEGEARRRRA